MRSEMFVLGFQTAQMTIAANLAGISHEESLRQPVQSGNCINWLAGHILTSRDGLKIVLGLDGAPALGPDESAPYKQGSQPLTEPKDGVSLERLVSELQNASSAIVSKLGSMPDSQFDTLLDPKMFPMPVDQPTLANFLTLLLFHEAYHSGQIGLGRRLLAKPSGLGI